MDHDNNYRQQLAARVAVSKAALRVHDAAARAEGLEVAKREAAQLRAVEVARLRRELGAAESAHTTAIEALDAAAEATRRERADALLAKIFGPDGLPALVAKWRVEPGRATTNAIHKLWAEFDATARAELGEALASHVLAVPFIDSIAAQVPGSMSRLCGVVLGGGVDSKTVGALGAWTRAADARAASDALEKLEAALLAVARRSAGAEVEARHVEQHALLSANATRGDLAAAYAAFTERDRKAANERFAATYTPPPASPTISERVMSWLSAGD
jgi:hypothetical protein